MKWNLEELTEDAVVSYLSANSNGDFDVYAAWDFNEPEYPCVIVHADATEPISEDAQWHDARMVNVAVAVITEAVDDTDANGNTIVSARQRNVNLRSAVLDLLNLTTLNTQLINQAIEDVAFSMAQVSNTERSVEDNPRRLITTISLEVIAEPVTGS